MNDTSPSTNKRKYTVKINHKNTILQFFIFHRLNEERPLSIERLARKLDGDPMNEDEIKKYINKFMVREEDVDFKSFFAYMFANWRLFVLLDFMHAYRLYFDDEDAVVVLVSTSDKKKEKMISRPNKELSKDEWRALINASVAKYDEEKKMDTENKKNRKKDKKKDKKKKIKAKYMNPIYDDIMNDLRDISDEGVVQSLAQVNLIIDSLLQKKKTVSPKVVKQIEPSVPVVIIKPAKIKQVKPVVLLGTIKDVRSELIYHRQLTVYVEWLRLQTGVTNGYAILPYMVEYVQQNTRLIKLLCIVAHRRDLSLLSDDGDDDLQLDDVFTRLPCLPYSGIMKDPIPVIVGKSTEAYLRHFVLDVLAPQYYIKLWTRIILLIREVFGLSSSSSKTKMSLSYEDAHFLHVMLSIIRDYLEGERDDGYLEVGFDRNLIDIIVGQYFAVDSRSMRQVVYPYLDYKNWPYADMKTECIKETLDSMRVGASCLYKVRDDGVTLPEMMNSIIMVHHDNGSVNTNNREAIAFLSMNPSIRTNPNSTGLYNDAGLMEAVSLIRDNRDGFIVGECRTRYTLSLGDMYNIFMRDGMTTPLQYTKAKRLLSLFTLDINRSPDPFSIYDQIVSLVEGVASYRPITEKIKEGRRIDVATVYNGKSIGDIKRLLESDLEHGVPLLERVGGTTTNRLSVIKSYRLVLNQNSIPGKFNSLDITHSNVADGTIIGDDTDLPLTLFVFYDEYRWVTMSDTDTWDIQPTNALIHCIIERRNRRVTEKLDKIVLSYENVDRKRLLVLNRKYVLRDLLLLDESRVTRYDVLAMADVFRIFVVIDNDDGDIMATPVDNRAVRIINLMSAYQRRLNYISMKNIVNNPMDDYVVDPSPSSSPQCTIVAGDDAVVVDIDDIHDDIHVEIDDDDDDNNHEVELEDSVEVKHVNDLFTQYRSWMYMSDDEKESLYYHEGDEESALTIQYVINYGLYPYWLISITPSLYGGTMKLQSLFMETSDTIDVTVEKLIHDIEVWIQNNPSNLALLVKETTR